MYHQRISEEGARDFYKKKQRWLCCFLLMDMELPLAVVEYIYENDMPILIPTVPTLYTFCSVCAKKTNLLCSDCFDRMRIIYYCGKECQAHHWPQHRVYCNQN